MTFGTETTHQYSISEDSKEGSSQIIKHTLGDFRNISTISIFLLAVAPYIFYNFTTKMV